MRFALVVTALLASTAAFAGKVSGPKPGTLYTEARRDLIAKGYHPGPVASNATGCSIGRERVCEAYTETVYCSGSGLALCEFQFWKNQRVLLVETGGEGFEELRVRRARLLTATEAENYVDD